ncbi:lysophospholipase-like protein 1 isoform X2 [Chiloscyllium plagiosum]|uniref:lysophospholipase-like protein 1 isoform X2 n=1 Tax=Chiloscyllium plagiosum TaxID=36176 RepID=UPI001CB803E9|nr:lysophospholipase-like protein 1 isoform X2 [Chiloscyllium plagiosum]
MAAILQRTVVAQAKKPTASVIFLHGSGDTGQGIRAWIKDVLKQDLNFQHIRIIYPTAPLRPYTPMNQSMSNVWFDRHKIAINCPEHLESIDSMCQTLSSFVEEEVNAGVAKDRIILGGFSMGGTMAMHVAYRFQQQVAGVFVLSSFLNKDSIVYQQPSMVVSSRSCGLSPEWKSSLAEASGPLFQQPGMMVLSRLHLQRIPSFLNRLAPSPGAIN